MTVDRAVYQAPFHRLISPAPCFDCQSFPCLCVLSPRVEPCVCGGEITVDDKSDPLAVVAAVKRHNETPAHADWRLR